VYEKTNVNGLYRESDSGAIVNRDLEALKQYKKTKQRTRMVDEHQARLDRMEKNLSEIHSILHDISERMTNDT